MDPKSAMYIAQGIHGLAYGMVLFLVASGLNIIFGMMGILNLAHASFFMLSAYFAYQFLSITGSYWAALLLAPLTTAFFGILLEKFLLRKVHAFGHMAELILTVGVSLVILAAVKIFWGTESLPVKIPPSLEGLIKIAGMDYRCTGFSSLRWLCLCWLLWPYCYTKPVWAKLSEPRFQTRIWSRRWELTHPLFLCSSLELALGSREWLESLLPRS